MRLQLHMALAAACVLCSGYLYVAHRRSVLHALAVEDSLVESLGAIFFFVAGAFFVLAAAKRRGDVAWLSILAAAMLTIAGEEISWGQRIFGWTTPGAIADVNVQGETTLHNLPGIHGNIRLVAVLFLTAFCAIVPATRRYVPALKNFYDQLRLPAFPVFALPWVGAAFSLMIVPRLLGEPIDDVGYLDEIGEMALAVAFLLFAMTFSPSRDDVTESSPAPPQPMLEGAARSAEPVVASPEDPKSVDLASSSDAGTQPRGS